MTGVQNPWHKLSDWFLEEQSGNPSLQLWLRVALLAQSRCRRNGHCPLGHGELQLAMQVVDIATGEIITPARESISRAISTAIRFGFLDPISSVRCLVPRAGSVHGGTLGSPQEQCKRHSKRDVARHKTAETVTSHVTRCDVARHKTEVQHASG